MSALTTSDDAATARQAFSRNPQKLEALLRRLRSMGYGFTTVTPETHALVNARPSNAVARSVEDVFGWSRPFLPVVLPDGLFELARDAGACEPGAAPGTWRPALRISSVGKELFAHSAFPTTAHDAVFFGPDSYRFVRAVLERAEPTGRAVDVGAGSGVGGIMLAKRGLLESPVVLADVNALALGAAAVNARVAGIDASVVKSDALSAIEGDVDLVIANPPYLRDALAREYRHGDGQYGEALSVRIARESLRRLAKNPAGGRLLLYTGTAFVRGVDTFFRGVEPELRPEAVRFDYCELDPDVFSSELRESAYADVDRIAVVLLDAHVGG